jgi:hypothetical protein
MAAGLEEVLEARGGVHRRVHTADDGVSARLLGVVERPRGTGDCDGDDIDRCLRGRSSSTIHILEQYADQVRRSRCWSVVSNSTRSWEIRTSENRGVVRVVALRAAEARTALEIVAQPLLCSLRTHRSLPVTFTSVRMPGLVVPTIVAMIANRRIAHVPIVVTLGVISCAVEAPLGVVPVEVPRADRPVFRSSAERRRRPTDTDDMAGTVHEPASRPRAATSAEVDAHLGSAVERRRAPAGSVHRAVRAGRNRRLVAVVAGDPGARTANVVPARAGRGPRRRRGAVDVLRRHRADRGRGPWRIMKVATFRPSAHAACEIPARTGPNSRRRAAALRQPEKVL